VDIVNPQNITLEEDVIVRTLRRVERMIGELIGNLCGLAIVFTIVYTIWDFGSLKWRE
jgi:hypothetical protein